MVFSDWIRKKVDSNLPQQGKGMAIRPAAGRGFEFKDSLNHSPGAHEDYEDNEVALDTLGDRDCGLTHQCIRYFLDGFVCRGGIVGGVASRVVRR